MGLEEQMLAESIRVTITNVQVTLRNIVSVYPRTYEEAENLSDEHNELDEHLRKLLVKLYRDTGILAERLALPLLKKDIDKLLNSNSKLLTSYTLDDDMHEYLICPAFDDIASVFQSLDSMISGKDIASLSLLENILNNTRKILVSAKTPNPKNEKEIYTPVGKILELVFPDLVKQVTLSRPLKSYKPEFGIKSLKSLIEYKYARTEEDLKTKVDELYTDSRGYINDGTYNNYYAVIYCSDQFTLDYKILKEFEASDIGPEWRIILCHGGGQLK